MSLRVPEPVRRITRKESIVAAVLCCLSGTALLAWPYWQGQLQWKACVERLYRDFDHQQSLECESLMGKMLETAHGVGRTKEFGDWLEEEAEARRQEIVLELAKQPQDEHQREYLDRRIRRLEHLYITLMVVRRQTGSSGLITPLCGMAAVDVMRHDKKSAKQHLELALALVREEEDGAPKVQTRAVSLLDRTYY